MDCKQDPNQAAASQECQERLHRPILPCKALPSEEKPFAAVLARASGPSTSRVASKDGFRSAAVDDLLLVFLLCVWHAFCCVQGVSEDLSVALGLHWSRARR